MLNILLFTACPGCAMKFLLFLLAALLLGLIAGYFIWGKYKKIIQKYKRENHSKKEKLATVETEFASLKYAHDELNKDHTALRTALNQSEKDNAYLQNQLKRLEQGGRNALSSAVTEKEVPVTNPQALNTELYESVAENLQLIEGIGPKIEGVLKDTGVLTLADLANVELETLQDILKKAGKSYALARPDTWIRQATYAVREDWKTLEEYQDYLRGGIDPEA